LLVAVLVYSGIIACALYTIAIHLDASGGQKLLENLCPSSVVEAYAQHYGVGVNAVDSVLCVLDTVFRTSLQAPVKDFTIIFMLNGPMALFIMLVESTRNDKPYVAYAPLLFGVLTQTIKEPFLHRFSGHSSPHKPALKENDEVALPSRALGLRLHSSPPSWAISSLPPG